MNQAHDESAALTEKLQIGAQKLSKELLKDRNCGAVGVGKNKIHIRGGVLGLR